MKLSNLWLGTHPSLSASDRRTPAVRLTMVLMVMLGLPFAFASHFAPAAMDQAMEIYRNRFEPSAQLDAPYVMLGYNICAADSAAEARLLRTSSLQSFVNLRRGRPGKLPPPVPDYEDSLAPAEMRSGDAEPARKRLSQIESQQPCSREVGAEGNWLVTAMPGENDERDPDRGADDRGQQNDERQRLPAEPGADGGQ